MEIDKNEMINITGGSISIAKWGGIAILASGIVSFFVGIIDGYLRPLSCNK